MQHDCMRGKRTMKFSLTAFGQPLEEYAAIAEKAEALGFEAFWLGDHVITPLTMNSRYPYSATGTASYGADVPVADTWVTVAHMAARTQKIKLGPGRRQRPLTHARFRRQVDSHRGTEAVEGALLPPARPAPVG
jgi:alkanesulfonate monooxygenase SsuD/methylene tetrahydromethanopterin reductase-like flavin-dependent oxidoreductase (luciferase family)